jgi:MFS family permease
MTTTRFRLFLIASAVLVIAAVVVGLLPGGYSSALADAYANEPVPRLLQNEGLAIAVLLVVLAATVAGFIGLFLLKRWGRTLSLVLTLFGLPLYLLLGPTLQSPVETMLADASSLLWGACLALAYFSPVSKKIEEDATDVVIPLDEA